MQTGTNVGFIIHVDRGHTQIKGKLPESLHIWRLFNSASALNTGVAESEWDSSCKHASLEPGEMRLRHLLASDVGNAEFCFLEETPFFFPEALSIGHTLGFLKCQRMGLLPPVPCAMGPFTLQTCLSATLGCFSTISFFVFFLRFFLSNPLFLFFQDL